MKCTACRSKLVVFGDLKPGEIYGCPYCQEGVGVVEGVYKPRRWWQRPRQGQPVWLESSRVPLVNDTPYSMEEAQERMQAEPFALWAPAERLKAGMPEAFSHDGHDFVTIGADSQKERIRRFNIFYSEQHGAWYELSSYRFYFPQQKDGIDQVHPDRRSSLKR